MPRPKHVLPIKLIVAVQSHIADLRGETQALLELIARLEAESPPAYPGPWSGYLVQALVALERADQSLQDVVDGNRPAPALQAISSFDA